MPVKKHFIVALIAAFSVVGVLAFATVVNTSSAYAAQTTDKIKKKHAYAAQKTGKKKNKMKKAAPQM
jgi:hypothetical protein